MGYGGYCWGLHRDYHRDPFPHSLLRTRQLGVFRVVVGSGFGGVRVQV